MSKSAEIEIPVKHCEQFLEDPTFAVVRSTLPSTWSAIHCEACNASDPMEIKNNMDNVTFHNDRFEVVVNVRGYEPKDIRCNVTADNIHLIAQNEGASPNGQRGTVQRNMSMDRSYQLPQTVNPEQATCYLSSDGILVVTAPWMVR